MLINRRNGLMEGKRFNPNGHNVLDVVIPSDNFTFTLSNLANYSGGTIDWGDGVEDAVGSASPSHVYATSGKYRIVMPDKLTAFGCQNADSRVCVTELWAGELYASVANGPLRYLSNCKVMHFAAPKISFAAYSLYSCNALTDLYANKIMSMGGGWHIQTASRPLNLHADISEITTLNNMNYLTIIGVKSLDIQHNVTLGGNCNFNGTPLEEIIIPNGSAPDKTYIQFSYCPNLRRIVIPCIDWISDSFCRNNPKLEYLEIGEITTFRGYYQYCFGNPATGRDAPLVDGIRLTIKCGNTMESLLTKEHFPFCYGGGFETTKWICADGYIVYEGGDWTPHATI